MHLDTRKRLKRNRSVEVVVTVVSGVLLETDRSFLSDEYERAACVVGKQ